LCHGLCHNPPFQCSWRGLRAASIRTWLYRSSIRRLTCPAIAMMVESDAPFSARDVIAQCRTGPHPTIAVLSVRIPSRSSSNRGWRQDRQFPTRDASQPS
jgi:hypothetical protein